ncbi:MAG TPA: hypothetical protein VMT76_08075 [Puia sp.]|nr:hypothetical protein [Puia sp.]
MKYDYVVVLKKRSDRQIDFISIFLCVLSIAAFIFNQVISARFNFFFTLVSIIITAGVLYNLFFLRDKSPRFKYLLFLAGISWIIMPYLQWVSVALFFLAFLEYQAKHPLEVGFSNDEILINTFIKRRFTWNDFHNIILKDGLLTLDFKNNMLFQKETMDDDEPDAEEDEFNSYCKIQLIKAKQQPTVSNTHEQMTENG